MACNAPTPERPSLERVYEHARIVKAYTDTVAALIKDISDTGTPKDTREIWQRDIWESDIRYLHSRLFGAWMQLTEALEAIKLLRCDTLARIAALVSQASAWQDCDSIIRGPESIFDAVHRVTEPIRVERRRAIRAAMKTPTKHSWRGEIPKIEVRPMFRRDLPKVILSEQECYEHPYDHDTLYSIRCHDNAYGTIARNPDNGTLYGHMLFVLHRDYLQLLRIAVRPPYRRKGIGAQMLETLLQRLEPRHRTHVQTVVPESNLTGQIFLRSKPIASSHLLKRPYDESDEDGVLIKNVPAI